MRLTGRHKDASLQAGSVDSFQLLLQVCDSKTWPGDPASFPFVLGQSRCDVTSQVFLVSLVRNEKTPQLKCKTRLRAPHWNTSTARQTCLACLSHLRPDPNIIQWTSDSSRLTWPLKHVLSFRFLCTPSTTVPFASRWSLEALAYPQYFGVFFPGFVFALLQRVHRQKKTWKYS